MEINFFSNANLILTALSHMLEHTQGHIVIVSSMDGKKGLPLDAPYTSAKYALAGFGDILRQELYGSGLNVTSVFPGRVDTAMIENHKVPWISAKISAIKCANAILNGVQHRKAEIILPPQSYLLHYLQTFSPKLADSMVRLFKLEGGNL